MTQVVMVIETQDVRFEDASVLYSNLDSPHQGVALDMDEKSHGQVSTPRGGWDDFTNVRVGGATRCFPNMLDRWLRQRVSGG